MYSTVPSISDLRESDLIHNPWSSPSSSTHHTYGDDDDIITATTEFNPPHPRQGIITQHTLSNPGLLYFNPTSMSIPGPATTGGYARREQGTKQRKRKSIGTGNMNTKSSLFKSVQSNRLIKKMMGKLSLKKQKRRVSIRVVGTASSPSQVIPAEVIELNKEVDALPEDQWLFLPPTPTSSDVPSPTWSDPTSTGENIASVSRLYLILPGIRNSRTLACLHQLRSQTAVNRTPINARRPLAPINLSVETLRISRSKLSGPSSSSPVTNKTSALPSSPSPANRAFSPIRKSELPSTPLRPSLRIEPAPVRFQDISFDSVTLSPLLRQGNSVKGEKEIDRLLAEVTIGIESLDCDRLEDSQSLVHFVDDQPLVLDVESCEDRFGENEADDCSSRDSTYSESKDDSIDSLEVKLLEARYAAGGVDDDDEGNDTTTAKSDRMRTLPYHDLNQPLSPLSAAIRDLSVIDASSLPSDAEPITPTGMGVPLSIPLYRTKPTRPRSRQTSPPVSPLSSSFFAVSYKSPSTRLTSTIRAVSYSHAQPLHRDRDPVKQVSTVSSNLKLSPHVVTSSPWVTQRRATSSSYSKPVLSSVPPIVISSSKSNLENLLSTHLPPASLSRSSSASSSSSYPHLEALLKPDHSRVSSGRRSGTEIARSLEEMINRGREGSGKPRLSRQGRDDEDESDA